MRAIVRTPRPGTVATVKPTDDAAFVEIEWDGPTYVGALHLGDLRRALGAPDAAQVRDALVALSRWIDQGNAHRDPEAVTWGRLAKIAEEAGEVVAAYIGATGQNPRKGVTHSLDDVIEELLDVAVTALGAVEHLTGHAGDAIEMLNNKIVHVATRAGAVPRALAARQPETTTTEAGPWQHDGHRPVQHRDGKPPWCDACGFDSPTPARPAVRRGEPRG